VIMIERQKQYISQFCALSDNIVHIVQPLGKCYVSSRRMATDPISQRTLPRKHSAIFHRCRPLYFVYDCSGASKFGLCLWIPSSCFDPSRSDGRQHKGTNQSQEQDCENNYSSKYFCIHDLLCPQPLRNSTVINEPASRRL